jgi:hypothetical protein
MQGYDDEAELLGWSLKSLARKARKVSHKALKVGVQIPIVGDKVKLARTVLNKADKATGGRIGKRKSKSKSKSKVKVVKKDNKRQRIKPERSRNSFDNEGRGKGKGKGLPMPLIIGGVGLGALLLLKK